MNTNTKKEEDTKGYNEFIDFSQADRNPPGNRGRYYDQTSVAELLKSLEEKVFDNGVALAKVNGKLYDLQKQLKKVEADLDSVKSPDELPEERLKFVSRAEWGATQPINPELIHPLRTTIEKIHITYSTKTDSCVTFESCQKIIKSIQRNDMLDGLPDIAHNFLMGQDGNIYEGRGWNLTPTIRSTNPKCMEDVLDIAFIGKYSSESYPYELYERAIALISSGVQKDIISSAYRVYDFSDGRLMQDEL